MLLIPVVQQSDSVIHIYIHIYAYTFSLKKDIKWQIILKIINLFKRILNDTPFLKLFLKFSLCRVSLAVGLSLLAVGGLLTAVPLLLHTSGFSPLFRARLTLCSEIKVSSLQVGPGNPLSQRREAPWWGQEGTWPWSAALRAPLTSSICSRMGETLGSHSLKCGAPAEHSRQSSLWVLGPQPTAGSTGATAPSVTLPTRGQTPATRCSCLSQVRNLFLAHALFFLFSCYAVSNSLWSCGLRHDRVPCPSLSPPHGSQPCSG